MSASAHESCSQYKISLNANTMGKEEMTAAIRTIQSGQLTMGKQCLLFEEQFAQYVGVKNAIFVNSGSSANLLAFFGIANHATLQLNKKQLQPGFEVIVPATTWPTT